MRIISLACAGLLVTTLPCFAAANLITNGNFSTETIGGNASTLSAQINGFQGYSGGATLTGWSNNAYAFVFTPGAGTSGTTADTTGATINQYGGAGSSPNVYLWGPGSGGGGVNNGLTNSPAGSNFVAIDGATGTNYLYQTVAGLTVGWQYTLQFYYAGAEQQGFTGNTTQSVQATFSDGTTTSSYTTATMNVPSQGFTGWNLATVTFKATAVSETLSFLAQGSPSGSPPMSLLDGVTLSAVPEPASVLMVIGAMIGLVGTARLRARKSGQPAKLID